MGDEEQDAGSTSEQKGSSDYQLGIALVSILVSILLSIGFGVYSMTSNWWLSILLGIGSTGGLAALIRIGGSDGLIPRLGQWVLGSRS